VRGGYGAIGQIPQVATGLVLIDTTPETLDAMITDGRWQFVEEVVDAGSN